MKPLRIGYLNFPWVYEADLPVLLAFGAEWDTDSLYRWRNLEHISEKYDGKLIIGFVDIEYARGIFSKFKITDFPTLIAIDCGKELKPMVGLKYVDDIEEYIQYIFGVLPYSPMEQY